MNKNKSSLSKAISYQEIGDFWDSHDLSKFWNQTEKVSFAVDIQSEIIYYAVDKKLSEKIQSMALQRGIPANTLVNLWVQEKLQESNI